MFRACSPHCPDADCDTIQFNRFNRFVKFAPSDIAAGASLTAFIRLVNCFNNLVNKRTTHMGELVDFPAKTARSGKKLGRIPRLEKGAALNAAGKISMREVARLAKVSVATVSMVLNENP